MKLLHTSDWHLGRSLDGRKRYAEQEAFLNWLADLVESREIDVLLVAGDVFDSTTPSHRAQELYYRFLCRLAASPERQVVVTAGNHDSPTLLDAPRELLKFLNIHVVGCAAPEAAGEVIVIPGREGEAGLIVCAVPYLRDRDLRTAEAGEEVEEKERKIREGIRAHYRRVYEAARERRAALQRPVPIVAMGHLYTEGGRTVDGDGVRELYIGSLLHVGRDVFPEDIDYLALGHLHIPQSVGQSAFIRYSGSPLAIGFGEARQQKSVALVEFSVGGPSVAELPVPCFQELRTLRGDWPALAEALAELKEGGSRAWIEVVYEGDEAAGDLQGRLDEAVAGTSIEVLRVRSSRMLERVLSGRTAEETLDDLDTTDVFARCLDAQAVAPERRPALLEAYREILVSLAEQDPQAE